MREFLAGWWAAPALCELLRNTRKTELPSASITRVFLSGLVARTAPFALQGRAGAREIGSLGLSWSPATNQIRSGVAPPIGVPRFNK